MNNIENLISWLNAEISKIGQDIILSYIFGSVASGVQAPNDCDLLIVTKLNPHNSEWNILRKNRDKLCEMFAKKFNFKLSVILVTKEEYLEINPLFSRILTKPIIFIHGKNINTPNNLINRTENTSVLN